MDRRAFSPSNCAQNHRFSSRVAVIAVAAAFFATSGQADTYLEWKQRVFSQSEQADPAISSELALSPAGDGIPNLIKYAFGLNPHQDGSLSLPQIGFVEVIDPQSGELFRYPTITYQAAATNPPTDIYYVPEISSDLRNWVRGDARFAAPVREHAVDADDVDRVTLRSLSPLGYKPCGPEEVCEVSGVYLRLHVFDGQSLPEDWQVTNFGYTGVDPAGDEDGDGRTNFDEFLHGTDPNDYYDGRIPVLEIVSGDGQRGFLSRELPFPLVVRLSDNGAPLVNAPVRFFVTAGSVQIFSATAAIPQNAVEVRTDEDGLATVSALLGATPRETSLIQASSGGQSTGFSEISLGQINAKVAAGDDHSLALDLDGVVWTWGDNSYGQLGDGTSDSRSTPGEIRSLSSIADIAGGSGHSIFVALDGSVWGCGSNWAGQVGNGTTDDQNTPVVVPGFQGAIAASGGAYHTIALRADGTVWAWGNNSDGELGNGTTTDSVSPVQVVTQSGAPLREIVAIAAGYYHNLALKADGTVWAWGANWWGALGDGSYLDHHYAIQVPGLSGVTMVKCGAYHAVAVQHTGEAGQGATVSLRSPKPREGGSPPSSNRPTAMPRSQLTTATDIVWAWGANFSNQLGDGSSVDSAVPIAVPLEADLSNIAAGFSHTLALTSAGTVLGWGSNVNGEATGERHGPSDEPTEVAGVTGIVSIAGGSSHSLALASNGLIYSWGVNSDGQLGIGNEQRQVAPVQTNRSSNRSGMPDWWQDKYFHSRDVDPNADFDGDGLTNLQEYQMGTLPDNEYSDSDDKKDGEDGWPLDGDLHPPRLPEYNYAVIDLGPGRATAINNNNEVVGDADQQPFIWKNGVRTALPSRGAATYAVAINDSGTALFYCVNAPPALWITDHYVDVTTGADSDKRLYGWDPNIVWQRVDEVTPSGINNAGEVIGNCWATWSGSPDFARQKIWPLDWSTSYSHPNLLSGTVDANDHDLTVDDHFDHGYRSDYVDDVRKFDFHGHFDNRTGLDNTGGVNGINNAGQLVGTVEHSQSVTSAGFPIPPNINVASDTFSEVTVWTNGKPEGVARGRSKGAQVINDDGVIVGSDVIFDKPNHGVPHTMLWVKSADKWKEKDLGVANAEEIRRINRNIQIIAGSLLYQNGHAVDIYTRIPAGYENLNLLGLNEAGFMVGQANAPDGTEHAILLVPAELLVDANRDGKMSFSDTAIHDADQTSQTHPYRFWVNDDQDAFNGTNVSTEVVPVQVPDNSDNKIQSVRDCEDLARVWVNFRGLVDLLATQNVKVRMRFKSVASGSPAIRLFAAAESNEGGTRYITETGWADAQVNGPFGQQAIGGQSSIVANIPVELSLDYLGGLTNENPYFYMLFEGVQEGEGELALEFWSNGQKIGETAGLWLDIKNIKKMYQRVEGASNHPWESAEFQADPAEDSTNLITFVHGWRMSPASAGNYAESMYKRLWHRGFKGRFAAYHWDTWWYDSGGWLPFGTAEPIEAYLSHYNDSEYIAWHAARSLRSYVLNAPFHNKNVVAHSMGNIVVGEALREGMVVNNYALLQAAVPAACYDEDEQRIRQTTSYLQHSGPFFWRMWDSPTPDEDNDPFTRSLAYRGTFSGISANANLINFYLPDDHATSFAWEVNNDQTKPPLYQGGISNAPLDFLFEYAPNGHAGQKFWKLANSMLGRVSYYIKYKPEAMAYASRTWGKAVGAWGQTEGVINLEQTVDLSKPSIGGGSKGFDTDHNAEFNLQIQKLKLFYNRLLTSLQISPNDQ